MFDSLAAYGPWLTVYGPWLIGGIAGVVAFFVTAAIVGVVVRQRDRARLEGPRRPDPHRGHPQCGFIFWTFGVSVSISSMYRYFAP
jgi:hypothetical protein